MKINNAKTIKVLAVILAMAFGIGSVMSHTILSETGRTVSLAAEANVVAQNAAPAQAEAKKMEREPQSGGFSSSDYGLAAVLSITAFVLTLGFTILSFVFERKRVHYQ